MLAIITTGVASVVIGALVGILMSPGNDLPSSWITYKTKVLPLEEKYFFRFIHSKPLVEADFTAKPMVMLIGQYSTGKTTLISHLLGDRTYPGMRISPEPSTDKFIVIMSQGEEKESYIIEGDTLVHNSSLHFQSLSEYGARFLQRFQGAIVNRFPLLGNINIVDTPGILSGEKQRLNRGYDFNAVLKWFSQRASRIYLMFDPYKVDISDELYEALEQININFNVDAVKIILNKVNMVRNEEALDIKAALLYNFGKIMKTPEIPRVFLIGSFWDSKDGEKSYKKDEQELFQDLKNLYKSEASSKVNNLIKRIHSATLNAMIISEIGSEFQKHWTNQKSNIIKNLGDVFYLVQNKYGIPRGNFPSKKEMQNALESLDFNTFPKYLDENLIREARSLTTHENMVNLKKIIQREIEARNALQ